MTKMLPDHGHPTGWRWVRLGEVAEVISGQHILELDYNQNGRGIGYLTGPADFGTVKPNITKWTEKPRVICEPMDVLVTVKGAGVGKINLSPDVPVAIGRQLMAIRGYRDLVDTLFLHRFLETCLAHFQGRAMGATVPGLSRDDLETLVIPLPPLREQRRIATIFNEQMAALEKARTAAQARLEAVKALPAAFLRQVFPQLGQPLPGGWSWVPLGEVLILRKEVVHPHDNPEGPSLFVGLEHIESNTGRRLGSVKVEMSELTGRKPRFFKDDIVYGYLRPYLNKVWIAEYDGLCSVDQYVFKVVPQKANSSYVAWFMRSPSFIENSPVGKTPGWLPRIRTEEVAGVALPLPPLTEQQRLATSLHEKMSAVDEARAAADAELAAINALPAALLRRAFAGEL